MYKKTNYDDFLKFNSNDIRKDLQQKINEFNPDFIFFTLFLIKIFLIFNFTRQNNSIGFKRII
jgi:hypothetical protein